MEWLRSRLQESEQARGAGVHLGAIGAGSVWSPSDADWLSAARIGRRRRAAAGTALADASVWPTHPPSLCRDCHRCLQPYGRPLNRTCKGRFSILGIPILLACNV